MDSAQLYTPPAPYARCALCGVVYRPGSPDSVAGHEISAGHAPRSGDEPATVPETVPGRLLLAAAARIRALQATFDALGELADTWDRTGRGERAAELRALLTRPVVRALDEHDEPDDGLDDGKGDA